MSRVGTWLIGGWAAMLIAAWLVVDLMIGSADPVFSYPSLLLVAAGAFLTIKVPHNPVGAVLMVGGSAWLVYVLAQVYAGVALAEANWPGGYLAAWIGSWLGALLPVSLSALVLLFPDGRVWGWRRWLLLVLGGLTVGAIIGGVLLWGVPASVLRDDWILTELPEYLPVDLTFIFGFLAVVPSTVGLILRYRDGDPVERQQIKWLLAAAAGFGATFLIGIPLSNPEWWNWAMAVGMALFPISVVIAVLRYRLYDIDRIISRTVSYVLVVAFLGVVVLGLVSVLALFLPSDDPLVVAVSTLVVFALFTPVRRRVQAAVDRRFNRSRYDAALVVESLAGLLRERVDPEGVVDDWRDIVEETMQPTALGVWVREEATS